MLMPIGTFLAGCVIGRWNSNRGAKKKWEKEKKELTQYMQLQVKFSYTTTYMALFLDTKHLSHTTTRIHNQEEIYRQREKQWQAEYQKLYKAYEEMEKETVERDYEEFKAPDTNNDDMISRAEFNIYVKKYLSSFPELSERDFPRFEEFDLDGDGIVSFEEWQQFLYLQKQKEAAAAAKGQQQQKGQYQDLLNSMYEQSASSNSFNSLNEHIQGGHRGRRRVWKQQIDSNFMLIILVISLQSLVADKF